MTPFTSITAGLPAVIVTVGRPAFGATALPVASLRACAEPLRSTTKTTGSSFFTPMASLPVAPKASAGVEVMTTREPIFLPVSWLLNDGKRSCAPRSRPTAPVFHVECASLPSRPLRMTAWIEMRSSLDTTGPVPSTTTSDSVLVTVSGDLTVTVGSLAGSLPLTVTALMAADVGWLGLLGASSPQALRMSADARTVADRAVVSRRDTGENLRGSGGCQAARQLPSR